MRMRLLWFLAFPALAFGYVVWPGQAQQPKADVREEAAIQKNAEAFVEAFHKGDAQAVAALWAPDGEYTDVTGSQLRGREAIEKAFHVMFSDHKDLKVRIEGLSLRFVTPEVAIEEGISEVFAPDGGAPSRARYANVHVKKDGQWLLSSVRESAITPSSNYEHLSGLEWAIGDWAGQVSKDEAERITLAWAENQNFIVGSFSTTSGNISVGSAQQWIGWDPLAKRLRSWSFDESGAFGEGVWTKDDNRWTIKTSSVLQDGKKAAATFIIAPIDRETISLQSKDRSIDGNALPDTKEVKLKRVK